MYIILHTTILNMCNKNIKNLLKTVEFKENTETKINNI